MSFTITADLTSVQVQDYISRFEAAFYRLCTDHILVVNAAPKGVLDVFQIAH